MGCIVMASVEVYNHQSEVGVSDVLLGRLVGCSGVALDMALCNEANGGGVLGGLDVVEVSIVSDDVIAQVHDDFMGIPGATDVITFAHGEIVLSAETAQRNAAEYGVDVEKEMMLYIVHGLLHLAGHEDYDAGEREVMERIQVCILEEVWE